MKVGRVFHMYDQCVFIPLGVVPGLNPDETLVAEERLFPPISSGTLMDNSGTNRGAASSQQAANQQQGRTGTQAPPMSNDK